MTSSTSSALSMRRAPGPSLPGKTGCSTMRPSARSSRQTSLGKKKCAAWSPCRWPISWRPTLKANSPRRPGPASTPGHEVTSSVMRSLALRVSLMPRIVAAAGARPPGEIRPRSSGLAGARQQLVEALVGLLQAALHARGDHAVALLARVEDRRRDDARAVPEVLEGRGLDRHVAGHALPLEGLHDALGRRDLAVGSAEGGLAAVRVAGDETPAPAGPHVHDVDDRGRAARPPPLGDGRGIGVGGEDAVARRVEDALDVDLALARGRDDGCRLLL